MNSAERRFALFILAAFLAVDAILIAATAASWAALDPDFFGIWATARFLQSHPAAEVYDSTALGAFQQSLRPHFTAVYPAPYSPVFLLAIRPLAWLPYGGAHLLWAGVTLAAFLGAGWAVLRRVDFLIILLLAPVTMLNAIYGQTGFLTAALLIAALLLMPARPWLAGLSLAVLCIKPQLALLMPLVLLARRDGKTIATTTLWLAALAVLSGAVLGWSIWWDWLVTLASHGQFIAQSRDQLIGIMATITAAVLSLGGGLMLAQLLQLGAALVMGAIVWIAWRRVDKNLGDKNLAMAATMVGTFLLTPYGFVYDTPVAMVGALLFLRHGRAPNAALSGLELAAVIFLLIAPLCILSAVPQPPATPIALLILFAVITRRMLRPV